MQPSEAFASALPSGLFWASPFFGVLLSIAILPAVAPRLWHRRMGWVILFWIAALLVPWATTHGMRQAAVLAWHAILIEYLPFVTLLLVLFVTGGGIMVRGGLPGSPAGNTALLALGILLALDLGGR